MAVRSLRPAGGARESVWALGADAVTRLLGAGPTLSLPVPPEHPGRNVVLSPGRGSEREKNKPERQAGEDLRAAVAVKHSQRMSARGGHRTHKERPIPLSFQQKTISWPLSSVQGAATETQRCLMGNCWQAGI